MVPSEAPPNQQWAEALAFLWGLKMVYNVGWPRVQLFGDNAAAAMRCPCERGRRYPPPSIRKSFVYLISKKKFVTVYVH